VDVGPGRAAVALVVTADHVTGGAHEDEGDDAAADHHAERDKPLREAQLGQEQHRTDPCHRPGQSRNLVEATQPPAREIEAGGQPHEALDGDRRDGNDDEMHPVDPAGVEVVAKQEGADEAANPGQGVAADAPLQAQEGEPDAMHAGAGHAAPFELWIHCLSSDAFGSPSTKRAWRADRWNKNWLRIFR
jgi:hypothetical protein